MKNDYFPNDRGRAALDDWQGTYNELTCQNLREIESTLAKALSDIVNYRGPHRTGCENGQMQAAANKVADALGDIRFMIGEYKQ